MSRLDRLGWALAAVLVVSCAAQAYLLTFPRTSVRTLPIFVPVSLEWEKQMREQRNQPAGRGGEEAVQLAIALGDETFDPAVGAALKPKIEALQKTRAQLLDARGRRHYLNIALMDVGVAVTRELTPEQWDRIHMNRDSFKARPEAEVFERLLGKLR